MCQASSILPIMNSHQFFEMKSLTGTVDLPMESWRVLQRLQRSIAMLSLGFGPHLDAEDAVKCLLPNSTDNAVRNAISSSLEGAYREGYLSVFAHNVRVSKLPRYRYATSLSEFVVGGMRAGLDAADRGYIKKALSGNGDRQAADLIVCAALLEKELLSPSSSGPMPFEDINWGLMKFNLPIARELSRYIRTRKRTL